MTCGMFPRTSSASVRRILLNNLSVTRVYGLEVCIEHRVFVRLSRVGVSPYMLSGLWIM